MDQIEKLREVQGQVETASQKVLQDTLTEGMEAALEAFRVTGNPKFPDEYRPALEAAMRFMWTRSVKGSAGVIIEQFKEDLPLETKQDEELLFDQILREFIEAYGARRVQQIFEATREQIMQMIATGQRRGLTLPEISRGIREAIPQISRTRAAVIARTETHTSSMYASQQVARTSRRPLVKKWVAVEDPRTRDFGEGDGVIDEFSHRAVDGQERPLDQPYAVPSKYGMSEPLMFPGDPNGSAGNVINCYVPGTLVSGRFVGGTRGRYVGPVIEIKTASGRKLTVTPNHPVITGRGVVAADDIAEGDYAVAYCGQVESTVGVANQDVNLGPSRIENVFAALRYLSAPTFAGVTRVDFHGDGEFFDGDIEVVNVKRELAFGVDATLSKCLDYLGLVHADTVLDHIGGASGAFCGAVLSAARRVMSGLDKLLSSTFAGLGHAFKHGLAAVPWRPASAFNSGFDRATTDANGRGNGFNAFAAFVALANNVIRNGGQASVAGEAAIAHKFVEAGFADAERVSDLLNRHPGAVKPDRVVGVVRKSYSGHVYDLQEVSGYMIADGLITHNCRCAEIYERAGQ